MQPTLPEALLVLVFRAARYGRRPNLTAFCARSRCELSELEAAFELLEERGLLAFAPEGERLTLQGLAMGAALSARLSARQRPLASCRGLAA
jgi:hypothetical protein